MSDTTHDPVEDAIWLKGLFASYWAGIQAYHAILEHIATLFMTEDQRLVLDENVNRANEVADADYRKFSQLCDWMKNNPDMAGFWDFYNSLGIVATHGNPIYEIGVRTGNIRVEVKCE